MAICLLCGRFLSHFSATDKPPLWLAVGSVFADFAERHPPLAITVKGIFSIQ